MVAERLGKLPPLFQRLDGSRYVALGEKGAGLAEDAGVALSFFGGIHGASIGRADS